MTPLPDDFLRLSIPERISLVQALWDSIAVDPHPPLLSDAQRQELERRAVEDDASPDDAIPWEQVKADILARLGRP
jgi:putative addiction module component (TIGR02574 family)